MRQLALPQVFLGKTLACFVQNIAITGALAGSATKSHTRHRLQMDVKFLERIPGNRKRLYQFTVIDDCTRIRVLKV